MASMGLPFFLEDSTGSLSSTVFSDHYSRLTVQISPTLTRQDRAVTTFRLLSSHSSLPAVILDFTPSEGNALGNVIFPPAAPIPIGSLLRPVKAPPSKFGRSTGYVLFLLGALRSVDGWM
jgi:hypothetical protein